MTTEWFEDTTYLATAFGLVLAVSRFGDFLAVSGGSLIAKWFGSYKWTLWAGALLTALSFVATIVYGIVDKLSEKAVPKKPKSPEKINFFAVFKFDGRFWLISLITMLYYGGVTPFLANASDFLTTKWGYSDSAAGLVSSLIILASMVLSPVLGKVVDTVGYRPYFGMWCLF
jgi:nitrate/nitrite transporter NarK